MKPPRRHPGGEPWLDAIRGACAPPALSDAERARFDRDLARRIAGHRRLRRRLAFGAGLLAAAAVWAAALLAPVGGVRMPAPQATGARGETAGAEALVLAAAYTGEAEFVERLGPEYRAIADWMSGEGPRDD